MTGALEAVAFDLDGTLADSAEGIRWSLELALAAVLPEVELPDITEHIGPPLPVMLEHLLPEHAAVHERIVAAFRARYDGDGWRRTVAYPGIVDALGVLRSAGLRLGVVTNKRRAPTLQILESLSLSAFIDMAVSPDSVRPSFPTKAAALADYVQATGLAPSQVAYVGDSASDGDAARQVGCPFLAVRWGYGTVERLRDGDLGCAASADDLVKLLLPAPRRP